MKEEEEEEETLKESFRGYLNFRAIEHFASMNRDVKYAFVNLCEFV